MSDVSPGPESNQGSNTNTKTVSEPSISERANDFLSQANDLLSKIDWTQMGKYG